MCEAQRASNDLNILVKVIKYMANRNDSPHPTTMVSNVILLQLIHIVQL